MPDYGFGRCDGHHEMVDLRLRKIGARRRRRRSASKKIEMRGSFGLARHHVAVARRLDPLASMGFGE
jgi:hypothetical protein